MARQLDCRAALEMATPPPCVECGHIQFDHNDDSAGSWCDYFGCCCTGYTDTLRTPQEMCVCSHGKYTHQRMNGPCAIDVCRCPEFLETAARSESIPATPNERNPEMVSASSIPKGYKLPNGETYYSRALGGYEDDVVGLRELAAMGKHVLLLGEPGCGKTALLQVAHPKSQNEIGHSKMTAWDMLWRPRPMPDGSIIFDPSPLNRAATQGLPFYLDETMRLSEDAFTPLFSAMDGRGFIVGGNIDGTDLIVKKGFSVIGASNPLVRGAFLPDAIASRFHILTVETSEDLLVKMEIDERLLVAWRNLTAMDGGETWRPSIRDMRSAQSFIDAGNMAQAAYALTGWRVPARDRATVASVVAPLLGVRVSDLGGIIK